MKARVIATGYIVDVKLSHYIDDVAWYITTCHASYSENELEFIDGPQDYWTRLEHQYAGMAMQGLLNNNLLSSVLFKTGTTHEDYINEVVKATKEYAHALVEKYKKEEKR